MNERRIVERVACDVVAAMGDGYVAFKALEKAWDDVSQASQSLRKILRENNPEDPDEIIRILRELEQISWKVAGFKRWVHGLI